MAHEPDDPICRGYEEDDEPRGGLLIFLADLALIVVTFGLTMWAFWALYRFWWTL